MTDMNKGIVFKHGASGCSLCMDIRSVRLQGSFKTAPTLYSWKAQFSSHPVSGQKTPNTLLRLRAALIGMVLCVYRFVLAGAFGAIQRHQINVG